MVTILKGTNLAIAFLLELVMLGALAYWGLNATDDSLLRWLLGFGAPVVAIALWARFMAHTSPTRLRGTPFFLLKLILFGVTALALLSVGQGIAAGLFVLVAVINQILLTLWKQE